MDERPYGAAARYAQREVDYHENLPRPMDGSDQTNVGWRGGARRITDHVSAEDPLNSVSLLREGHMLQTHQPDQAVFQCTLPEDINWQSFSAFPPSMRLAVVVDHPAEPGPYVIRVKAPRDMQVMPHTHPEHRIYTVISGVFYIGLGGEFDGDKVKAYPPGTAFVLPGNTPHFRWAKSGEYVAQVTAIGPLGLSSRPFSTPI